MCVCVLSGVGKARAVAASMSGSPRSPSVEEVDLEARRQRAAREETRAELTKLPLLLAVAGAGSGSNGGETLLEVWGIHVPQADTEMIEQAVAQMDKTRSASSEAEEKLTSTEVKLVGLIVEGWESTQNGSGYVNVLTSQTLRSNDLQKRVAWPVEMFNALVPKDERKIWLGDVILAGRSPVILEGKPGTLLTLPDKHSEVKVKWLRDSREGAESTYVHTDRVILAPTKQVSCP